MHININKEKKIITIAINNQLTAENMQKYVQEINKQIDKLSYKNKIDLNEWRFNIYTCYMIINKKDLKIIKEFFNLFINMNFKLIDIITSKPQKLYKEWIDDIINKYFNNYHIKTLATNNIFKF